jgi:hypothetical protein
MQENPCAYPDAPNIMAHIKAWPSLKKNRLEEEQAYCDLFATGKEMP